MATAIFDSPLKEIEGETIALSTTADYLLVKPGFHEVTMYCASQWRLALSPPLLHCLYYDTSAGTYTEYKTQAADRDDTTHVPLDAMATGDYLYLGFSEPALGVYFNIDASNKNDNTATLDVEYCSTAVPGTLAFTDVSGDSDGTDSAGDTLKQDGVYTWTLPSPASTWKESTLGTSATPLYTKCWWIRFAPSATLSATVDVIDLIPVYQNTNYKYMEAGIEYQFSINIAKVSGFVYKATAGTPSLNIGWIKH